ncbi:MAG: response regulator [Opitutales bacterium]|nr:response regulator [Opitutales bacterium]
MPSTPPSADPAAAELADRLVCWRDRLMVHTQEVWTDTEAWLAGNAPALNSPEGRAVALIAGLAASRLSRNKRAVELLESVRPHLPPAADEASAADCARVLRSLGSSKGELGDSAGAFALYLEALETARAHNLLFEEGACHNNLGNLLQATGAYEKAVEHYRQGLRIFRGIDHEGAVLVLLANLAALLRLLGDSAAALAYLKESETLSEKVGDARGLGTALYNTHEIHLELGQTAEAEAVLERSIAVFLRAGIAAERFLATGALARICFDNGKEARARALLADLETALAAGPGEDERLYVGAVMEYARLLYRCGSAEAADGAMARVFPVAERLALRPEIVQILEARAEWAQARGDHPLAADLLRQTLAAERDLHRQQSEEALRKQQVSMEVDRLREAAERERTHTRELEIINTALAASRDEAAQQAGAARRASEAKGRFLSVMSHELRTPVNAIHGCARLLGEDLPEARRKACLDLIRTASESLVTLVSHQLDLAKIEAGRVRVAKAPFRLDQEIRAALLSVAPAAANKGLLLLPWLAPGLPARPAGDGFRLRQILINLLGNAVRFTASGHVFLEVNQPSADLWEFRVRDTGPGMTPEQCQRIFEAFEQGDARTEALYGGTGLGLTICDQLARLMGGGISVESTVGVGTTFTLRLPLVCGKHADDAPVLPAGLPPVYLAFGDAALRAWTHRILTEAGARIEEARKNGVFVLGDGGGLCHPALLLDRRAFAEGAAAQPEAGRVLPLPALPGDLLAALLGRERVHAGTDLPIHADFARSHPLRILLVEDDPASRAMIEAFLEQLGYAPACAANGQEALAYLRKEMCDLVITDLHMPEMDGEQLTAALRAEPRFQRLRIVAASATRELTGRHRAAFDGFLPKPLLPEHLMEMLRTTATGWTGEAVETIPFPIAPVEAADRISFVDTEHWQRLRAVLPETRLRELLSTALTDLDRLLNGLQASLATDEPRALVRRLHRVSGIAAHYGLRALEEAASRLEEDARCPDRPDAFLRELENLRHLYGKTRAEAHAQGLSHEIRP